MTGARRDSDPIDAWRDISARAARSGGVRPARHSGGGAGWPLGVLVLAVVAVIVGWSARQVAVATDPSPSASAGRDPLHVRADQLLAAWAATESRHPEVAFVGDLTGQTGDWEEAVGENNKRALMAGLLTAAAPLAPDVPPEGDVRWADGDTVTVPLLSATRSLEDLALGAVDSCPDCTRLEVTGATLTTVAVETTRGPAVAPAWRFALAGTAVTVTRIAVVDATVADPLPPLPQGQYPALQWIERAVGSASDPSLVVHFTGAPQTASQPCGADYSAEAVESSLAVVVIVTAHPNPAPASCRLVGADRTATVILASNLGDRAVIDIVLGLAVRLEPSSEPTSPAASETIASSPTAAATEPSGPPVTATADDGTFRLDLTIPRAIYGPSDAIEPSATLTYIGPDPSVTYGHASPAAYFTIEEVGGDGAQMSGGADDLCQISTLARGKPTEILFQKSGQIGLGFDRAWFEDPVLRLPIGTWRIAVRFEAGVPECGADPGLHEPVAQAVITVR